MSKVIILMSSYNGEKYIVQQIESILHQKDCEVCLIVRDDGSTDRTVKILQEYENRGLLCWYTGENLKPALSFMHLLYNSPEADYYAFADQDDIWDPDKISVAIEKLQEEKGSAFYHSNAYLADANGNDTGVLLHRSDVHLNFYSLACAGGILGCTMVFNKALRNRMLSSPFPKFIRMHDYYLGMVCLSTGGTGIYDTLPHIHYRQHGGNVVGIPVGGIINKLKSKIRQFNTKSSCSIADQAQEILEYYGDKMVPQYRKQCRFVASYKDSITKTIRIALSPKTHYPGKKNSVFIRLCLLFRRR